jgi:carbonic anhydrase/acetyltransferase-like protein (isoleucine patch superfamily)
MGGSATRFGRHCLVTNGRRGRVVHGRCTVIDGSVIDSNGTDSSVIDGSVIDSSGTVGAHAGVVVWLDFPRREDADNDVANRHSRAC